MVDNWDCNGDGIPDWDRQRVGSAGTYWDACPTEINGDNNNGSTYGFGSKIFIVIALIIAYFVWVK